MKLRGGEFSTGTMGNFQPESTFGIRDCLRRGRTSVRNSFYK